MKKLILLSYLVFLICFANSTLAYMTPMSDEKIIEKAEKILWSSIINQKIKLDISETSLISKTKKILEDWLVTGENKYILEDYLWIKEGRSEIPFVDLTEIRERIKNQTYTPIPTPEELPLAPKKSIKEINERSEILKERWIDVKWNTVKSLNETPPTEWIPSFLHKCWNGDEYLWYYGGMVVYMTQKKI